MLEGLLERATHAALDELAEPLEILHRRAARHLELDRARLTEYYDGIARDLQRRIERASDEAAAPRRRPNWPPHKLSGRPNWRTSRPSIACAWSWSWSTSRSSASPRSSPCAHREPHCQELSAPSSGIRCCVASSRWPATCAGGRRRGWCCAAGDTWRTRSVCCRSSAWIVSAFTAACVPTRWPVAWCAIARYACTA